MADSTITTPATTTADAMVLKSVMDNMLNTTNIGLIERTNTMYMQGDTSGAKVLNASIVPLECADSYHKTVNEIFFNTWGAGFSAFSR